MYILIGANANVYNTIRMHFFLLYISRRIWETRVKNSSYQRTDGSTGSECAMPIILLPFVVF